MVDGHETRDIPRYRRLSSIEKIFSMMPSVTVVGILQTSSLCNIAQDFWPSCCKPFNFQTRDATSGTAHR